MRLRSLLTAAAVLLPVAALAHVRLIHPSNGNPLGWSSPSSIGIVINSDGSSDLPDGSHETALRMAIDDWNATTGTSATLVEDTTPSSQARTDFGSSSVHLILFDETNLSGYFPGGSSTVALTPVWFSNSGVITDADILFNGVDHSFTTSGEPGRFDVQDVGAHELGHLLGLDHSGFAGSTMYPYVDPTVILHRSLSRDEEQGLRDAYPGGGLGNITGKVRRASDSSVVVGAYVAARDADGRTVATILTDASGDFTLRGMDPGDYTIYAVPLGSPGVTGDAPVSAANLGTGHVIENDFEPAIYASTAAITTTETVDMGTLMVGADVTLNLGTSGDRYPVRIVEGTSQTVTLFGKGLLAPATLTASDPDILITNPMYFGSLMSFQVTVPADEDNGHIDLTLVNSTGDLAILPGGLEITPPTPTVTNVTPGIGSRLGGTAVTLTGTEFKPGARVVIGNQIYTDGLAGTTVVNETTITLTTVASNSGTHDVVVLDPSGIEGRAPGAFQVSNLPVVAQVFPEVGTAAGGTVITVTGQDFEAGSSVRIDGVDQGTVDFVDSTQLTFMSQAGAAGGPYVMEVETSGGLATSAFAYVVTPDPVLATLDPAEGTKTGGDVITVTGSNFTANTMVTFGVDATTGLGGTPAAAVTFVDSSTLTVETPSFTTGSVAVLVEDTGTGQADVLTAAFAFKGESGGGCAMVRIDGPPSGRDALLGAWWMLAVFTLLAIRCARARIALTGTF